MFARRQETRSEHDIHREVIEALYRSLLGREPDEAGLAHWTEMAHGKGIGIVLEHFVRSSESLQRLFVTKNISGHWSLSQYREVELMLSIMIDHSVSSRYIVDVGASGIELSNSLDLVAAFGFKGLLIEANPHVAHELALAVGHLDVEVVNCAVAATEGAATFYLGNNNHLSSLHRDHAEQWGELRGEITVQMRRLGNILQEHRAPQDFAILSIDVEGVDHDVLNDLISTTPYRPRWVIIEWGPGVANPTMNDDRICQEVRDEYRIIGGTFSNVFLQHQSVDSAG